MKTTGFHTHRFADNPEEQRFAEAWDRMNGHPSAVNYLLHVGDGNGFVPAASDRERAIVATVIQWLGSPVGQGFLRDLGYERKT